MKNFIRWALFLPAGILAAFIINWPLHIVLYVILSFIHPYPESPELIIGPMARVYALVLVSAIVSPSPYIVAKTMALVCIVMIISSWIVFGLFVDHIGPLKMEIRYYGFPLIMGLIGAQSGMMDAIKWHLNKSIKQTD